MWVYVGDVVDVVEWGLFLESRCIWDGCIVSLGSGCVRCCAFCLICDAWSCKCWYIGSMLVSSCRCCMLVLCVHPVAILSAVFCIICSLSMLVSDALGDQIV